MKFKINVFEQEITQDERDFLKMESDLYKITYYDKHIIDRKSKWCVCMEIVLDSRINIDINRGLLYFIAHDLCKPIPNDVVDYWYTWYSSVLEYCLKYTYGKETSFYDDVGSFINVEDIDKYKKCFQYTSISYFHMKSCNFEIEIDMPVDTNGSITPDGMLNYLYITRPSLYYACKVLKCIGEDFMEFIRLLDLSHYNKFSHNIKYFDSRDEMYDGFNYASDVLIKEHKENE